MSEESKLLDLPGHLAATAVINNVRPAYNLELMTIDPTYKYRPIENSTLMTDTTLESERKQIITNIMLFYAARSAQDLINSENTEATGLSQTYNDLILSPEYPMNTKLLIAYNKYFLEYGAPNSYQEIEEIFGETETEIEYNSPFPENEEEIKELIIQRAILEAKKILEQNSCAVTNIFGNLVTKKGLNGDEIKQIMNCYPCVAQPDQENSL